MSRGRAAAASRTLYIAPGGTGDGSSWRTSAPLRDLGRLIERVRPGGEIRLAADRGEYRLDEELDLSAGGVRRNVISVHGVNSETGELTRAVIRGNRTQSQLGDPAITLWRGADHLHFSYLDFRDIGNGCLHVGGPISGLTIEDCAFENVYRFLENTAGGDEDDASMRDFGVRRCRGTRSERGFLRIRYASQDGLIEDCAAQGRANEGGAIPAGCALEGHAKNIVYRRCVMANFQQWHAGSYWNGDGFSDEADNESIRYEGCEARGSTDGGFDCKSPDVILENCVAEDNKRNFRVWGQRATLRHCTSRNPHFRGGGLLGAGACHIWVGGEGARIRIADLTIEDRDAVDILEFDHDSASVEVSGATIHSPRQNWGHVNVQTRANVIVAEPQ